MNIVKVGIFVLLEKLLHWVFHWKVRGIALKYLGARIGQGTRINEVTLSSLWNGFKNLSIGDNTFVGDGTFIDLTGEVKIGERTSISPRCILITHSDPGSMFGSSLSDIFRRKVGKIYIGNDTWIGAGTIVLPDVHIGNRVVVGAGSLIKSDIPSNTLAYGSPVKLVKEL